MLRMTKLAAVLSVCALTTACQRDRDRNREGEGTTTRESPEMTERRGDTNLAEKRERETQQALLSAKDEYRNKINGVLAELDKHVTEMKGRKIQDQKERKANQDRINNLAKRRELLQNDLKLLDSAAKDNWSDLKDQIDRDIEETREAFEPMTGKT